MGLLFALGLLQGWQGRLPPGTLDLESAIAHLPADTAIRQSRLAATIDFGNVHTVQAYVQACREAELPIRLDAAKRWARVASADSEAHLLLGKLLLEKALRQGREDGMMDAETLLDAEVSLRRATRLEPSNERAKEALLSVEQILGTSP